MTPKVAQRLAKAERFLGQAMRQSPEEVPEAVIHTAYYAMLHAAAALIVARQGQAPKTHGSIIGLFSRMIEGHGDHARSLGRAFNRAEDRRLRSDYDEVFIPSAAEATKIRESAIEFVAYCRSLL
jgi:uncharacterized protein (UPF0332 family)